MYLKNWDRKTIIADRNYRPTTVQIVTGAGYLSIVVSGTSLRFKERPGGGWDLDIDNAYAREVEKRDWQYELVEGE